MLCQLASLNLRNSKTVSQRTRLEVTAVGVNNARKVMNLKVAGSINGYDVMVIRNKFTHLTGLDLSEATIKANSYQYYDGSISRDSVIGSNMFRNLKIKRVVVPKSTKSIDNDAFYGSAIEEVKLNDGLKSIGDEAFYGCGQLKSIVIPETVKSIGSYAFYRCYSLESVELPNDFTGVNNYVFYGCRNLQNINLKNVKSIGGYAFENCDRLESLNLPYVTSIGYEAFYSCDSLKNVSLPSVVSIDSYAFSGCNLEEIKLSSSLTSISDYAFSGSNLKKIYVHNVEPLSIPQNTFSSYSATLYVPKQSWDSYYWNANWGKFKDIQTFDEPYDYFYLNSEFTLNERFDSIPDIDINPGAALVLPASNSEAQGANNVHMKSYNPYGSGSWASILANGNLDANNLYFDTFVEGNTWYFFSLPYRVKRSNISCGNSKYVFRYYDGAERAENGCGGWKNLPDTLQYLEAGKGYIFQADNYCTLTMKVEKEDFGKMEAEDVTTKLALYASNSNQNANWNFVGNATTGYYDINEMGITAPITLWNSNNNTLSHHAM